MHQNKDLLTAVLVAAARSGVRNDVNTLMKKIGKYEQLEFQPVPCVEEVGICPERAYGIACHNSENLGWEVWEPFQAEQEGENLSKEDAIKAFLDLASKAHQKGFYFLVSNCSGCVEIRITRLRAQLWLHGAHFWINAESQ